MLHKNSADKFSFEDCKFTVQRSKESTGRWPADVRDRIKKLKIKYPNVLLMEA